MSDFLTSLTTRALQPSSDVQPQLLSLFEPGQLDGEPSGADATSIAGRTQAAREKDIASEKGSIRRVSPHTVATRLDQIEAMLLPRVNTPTVSALQPPVSRRDNELPRKVFEGDYSPAADPDATDETPVTRPLLEPKGDADEAKPNRIESVTRVTASSDPVIADARPELKIALLSPRIIPAHASPTTAQLRFPRESKPRGSDPRRGPEPRVIQISIGRVEIRASTAAPSPRPRASQRALQAMTLDEYLRHKSAGGAQ